MRYPYDTSGAVFYALMTLGFGGVAVAAVGAKLRATWLIAAGAAMCLAAMAWSSSIASKHGKKKGA